MPALRDAGKNLARLREISAIVARHGFGQFFEKARIFERLGFRPKVVEPSQRLSTPARFKQLLVELGPTFVKLGQVLSSRPDILPPEWVRELSTLQDQVPELPVDEIRRVVEEGLGKPVAELFQSIDVEPLASASIAQVHGARTLDGIDVVVKVQRPGIGESIRADLDLLYYFAQFLEKVVEETGVYTPTGIVEEFERSLTQELDFLNEAANVRQFHRNNEGRETVVIPRVFETLTCRTVLTLERLHGDKITSLDPARFDRKVVATNLINAVFEHLFVDGLFHGDPHPGNVFVLDGNRIGLVDFGLVGRMSRHMQETLVVLCLAVALRDPDTVARLLYKVGVPDRRIDLAQFRADIAVILDRYMPLQLQDIKSASVVGDLLELALRYRIKVPKEYAILSKAAITAEGVVRELYPEMDIAAMAMPHAKRLLYDRMSPDSGSGMGLRTLLQAQGLLSELPLQLSQILMDLEGGRFTVTMKNEDVAQLVQAVRWLGIVVFSGLTASALIIGAFSMLAAQTDLRVLGVPVLAVAALLLVPLLFSGAFFWTLLSGRVHKISLRRLFGGKRK